MDNNARDALLRNLFGRRDPKPLALEPPPPPAAGIKEETPNGKGKGKAMKKTLSHGSKGSSSISSEDHQETGNKTKNVRFILQDMRHAIDYASGMNLATEDLTSEQRDKWNHFEKILHKEANAAEMTYREVSATVGNIHRLKILRKSIQKDQQNMSRTLQTMQKQEEAAMESEIGLYEEDILNQYHTSLKSDDKQNEMEALQIIIFHKRRALDLLEQLTQRALLAPISADATSNALALKAVARRGARFPVSRTEALRAHARARRRDRETRGDRSGTGTRSISPGLADRESSSDLVARPDSTMRSLFGDLFMQTAQSSQESEPQIIPLTYFETSV